MLKNRRKPASSKPKKTPLKISEDQEKKEDSSEDSDQNLIPENKEGNLICINKIDHKNIVTAFKEKNLAFLSVYDKPNQKSYFQYLQISCNDLTNILYEGLKIDHKTHFISLKTPKIDEFGQKTKSYVKLTYGHELSEFLAKIDENNVQLSLEIDRN